MVHRLVLDHVLNETSIVCKDNMRIANSGSLTYDGQVPTEREGRGTNLGAHDQRPSKMHCRYHGWYIDTV